MTLLLMDSCRQPGNISSQWTNFNPPGSDPAKIGGLQHYSLDNDQGITLAKDLGSDEDDVVIVGARFYLNSFDIMAVGLGGNDFLIRLNENGTVTPHIMVKLTSGDGTIEVERSGGGFIASSVTGAYPINAWFHLEAKIKIHDTTGTVQVRVDGTDVINETGLDTRNGGTDGLIDKIEIGSAESNSAVLRVCDIYMLNEQGSAPLNDLIGPHTIESLRTDAAGNYTNWTPSAGANHDAVDDPTEAVHDGDATYVETTVAERDSYSFGNLVSGEDPIAVMAKATSRFTGTSQDFNTFLRRSATDDDGPTETGNGSAFADRAITCWETDPSAAAAWTKANLEATEFGIRTT